MRFAVLALCLVAAGCDSDPFDADGEPFAASEVDVPATPVGGYAALAAAVDYPRLARDAGLSGRVFVDGAVVPGEGVVDPVVRSTPSDLLSSAVLAGVRRVAWTPARLDGRGVAAKIGVCVDMVLTGETDAGGDAVTAVQASACSSP